MKHLSIKTLALATVISLGISLSALAAEKKAAPELQFFTIGTGGTGATYYPIGGMIANAISKPPGSRECDQGGSCGVEGLIASAVSSRGSVDNVNGITSGLRNSGFAQSDVAFWAHSGTGTMDGQPAMSDLRAIAALFPEHVHLIVPADSKVNSVTDLKGLRVNIDEPGSGVYVDSNLVLEAYGMSTKDIKAEYLKTSPAMDALRNGKIDAAFVVTGYPSGSIVEVASAIKIRLVPIVGSGADKLLNEYGFFSVSEIPSNTYENVPGVTTIAVGAQWITGAKESTELIYNITKALWNKKTRKLLDEGHKKAKSITLETALDGIGIPLHPGAEKYYKEIGMIK